MSQRASVWTLLPLFFVLIIDAMGIGIIMPVIGPIFMSKAHGILAADASQYLRNVCYGATLVIFFVFMFIGAPFLGDLSDKYGRKKIIIICLFITAVSYFFCAFGIQIHSVLLLLFGRALAGFMAGSQPIAQAAIIDVSASEDKAKNLGLITMASCLGFVVGPLLGGLFSKSSLMASWMDYSTPFYLAALLATINGILVWHRFKETHQPKGKVKIHISKGLTLFASAFKYQDIRILSIVFGFLQLSWGLYFQFVSLFFIATYHFNAMRIGFFMAYIGLVFTITLTLVIRTALRLCSLQRLTYIALLLTGCGILLNSIYHEEWIMWLAVIPTIIGIGLGYTTLLTLYSNQVKPDQQGWVMGVSMSIVAVSWIVGGIITATIGAISLTAPFSIAALASLVAAGILYGFRSYYHEKALS